MAEFIQNPRRSPRAPARCRTAVVSASGTFEATTEDVGGHGCQLVSPRLVRKGEPVQLVVSHETMKDPLRVAGRVAWASDRAPWRLGIAYDEGSLAVTQAWFDELIPRIPGLSAFRRIPDRIPIDAVVYLASPPRFLVDFAPDEVALLRAVGSGTSVAELRSLLRDRWQPAQRALFSLLAHQHVTLSRGASVHPDAWRKILSEAESALAVESLRMAPVPALTPPPMPLGAPRPPAPPRVQAQAPTLTPLPVPAARRTPALTPLPTAVPAGASPFAAPAPAPHFAQAPAPAPPFAPAPAPAFAPAPPFAPAPAASAGTPRAPWTAPVEAAAPAQAAPAGAASGAPDWLVSAADMMTATWPTGVAQPAPPPPPPRGQGRGNGAAWTVTPPPLTGGFTPPAPPRTQEAQGCFERALAELEAGRKAGAMALLRRALALAPGDPEIAGVLARLTGR